MVIAFLPGLLTGLSLIIAIGAQNAFVIRQGLAKSNVLLVVVICAASDALLIFLGTGGLGAVIQSQPRALEIIRWFGVAYLTFFGLNTLRKVFRPGALSIEGETSISRKAAIASVLGFTFLNPHVYLDTVILLGSISNQFHSDRWYFALGAAIGSILWFSALGFGARAASRFMTKLIFWKVLDYIIANVMFAVAIFLIFYDFKA
ncbi:LysE/ArgO family amino acid transporter [Candidatus Planktophila versatilis]|uniref:L-lysine exporter family protein LysE/ArgO n=1 Tax=Candidatus Planktophila versatilis TaxID=1884905 RepID=A0ABM6MEK6_9ACTN|nr:L-lysine exporter family protein LysE/ArgO [Candidatus Planktophila versatilis]